LASSQVTLEPTATPEQLSYDGQQMLNTLGPGHRMLMIGAALLATGVGIAVAVPAVLVYNYFLRRLKLTAVDLDDFAHDFYSVAQKHSFRVLLHPVSSKSGATVAGQKVKEVS